MTRKDDKKALKGIGLCILAWICGGAIILSCFTAMESQGRKADERIERLLKGQSGVVVTVQGKDFYLVPNEISPNWKGKVSGKISEYLPEYKRYLDSRVKIMIEKKEDLAALKKDLSGPFIVREVADPET